MFTINATYLSWILLALFGHQRGKFFFIDTSLSADRQSLPQFPVVLSPSSLSFLSLLWCLDELVAKGHSIASFDFYNHTTKLTTFRVDQDHYLAPFFLSVSYADLVEVLLTHFQKIENDPNASSTPIYVSEVATATMVYVATCEIPCEQTRLLRLDFWRISFFDTLCIFVPDTGSSYDVSSLLDSLSLSWCYSSFSPFGSFVCPDQSWAVVLGWKDLEHSVFWLSFDVLLQQVLLFLHHYSSDTFDIKTFSTSNYMIEWEYYCKQLHLQTDHFLNTISRSLPSFIPSSLFLTSSVRSDLFSLLNQRVPFVWWIGSFPLESFSLWSVTWYDSLRYFFSYLNYSFQHRILPSLLNSSYESFCWFQVGGDNKDFRASLILQNFFSIKHGISIGSFVPPCYLVLKSNEPRRHLYELFSDLRPVLLMFVGIYPNHDSNLQDKFNSLSQKIAKFCHPYLVTNQYDIGKYDEDMRVLWDYDASVHKLFHCPVTMLYLIRSDGYVLRRWLYQDYETIIQIFSH